MNSTKLPRVLLCRSNPVAPDPRVEKTAETLLGAGYAVIILCWDRTSELPVRELVNGVPCVRLPIRAEYGTGMGNFLPVLRWQWSLLSWLVSHRKQLEIIHACDFDTVLPAMIMKRLFGKKVVYDIFDFYAEHLRVTPRWIKCIIKTLDLCVINMVDCLIVTDDARWAQLGIDPPETGVVIYNTPQDVRQYIKEQDQLSPSADLCLVYVGLLQVERGLLDVLALLKQKPNWHMDLAGFGGDEAQILEMAGKMKNVHWHGRIPYQRALEMTHAADVVLALYDPALPNHRYASPNKLFEGMMLGKPVIVARDTHVDTIVSNEKSGLIVEYGDLTGLNAALEMLEKDIALRQKLGTNGRAAYEDLYSWVGMEKRLLRLYAQLG